MLLSRCGECGAPLVLRAFGCWNPDGTITAKPYGHSLRISFIEQGELTALLDGISSSIGYPIDKLVVAGERKANGGSVDEMLSKKRGLIRSVAHSAIGMPVTEKIIADVAIGLGHGRSEILEHKRGKLIRVRVSEPYNAALATGDLLGTYEAHFLMTAVASCQVEGDSVVITIEKDHDGMTWQDPTRLTLKKMPTFEGQVEFERCGRCDVPLAMTRKVSWNTSRGIITNNASGARQVMIIVEAINAVIRELTWELGETIPDMVREAEQAFVASEMVGTELEGTAETYAQLLSDMTVFGQGNPVEVTKEGVLLTVRVDNPFCEPLIAGRIAGFYQAVEGVETNVIWSPGTNGYTVIQAWPV